MTSAGVPGGIRCSRQIGPEKGGMIEHPGFVNRQARQDGHAGLTGKPAPALRVVRLAQPAIAVKVEVGLQARVGAQGKAVG